MPVCAKITCLIGLYAIVLLFNLSSFVDQRMPAVDILGEVRTCSCLRYCSSICHSFQYIGYVLRKELTFTSCVNQPLLQMFMMIVNTNGWDNEEAMIAMMSELWIVRPPCWSASSPLQRSLTKAHSNSGMRTTNTSAQEVNFGSSSNFLFHPFPLTLKNLSYLKSEIHAFL